MHVRSITENSIEQITHFFLFFFLLSSLLLGHFTSNNQWLRASYFYSRLLMLIHLQSSHISELQTKGNCIVIHDVQCPTSICTMFNLSTHLISMWICDEWNEGRMEKSEEKNKKQNEIEKISQKELKTPFSQCILHTEYKGHHIIALIF